MSGTIVPGDARRFEELLDKEGASIRSLGLRSPGGDVAEAIQIGRTVRKRLLRTSAPTEDGDGQRICFVGGSPEVSSECVCLSSCFLIYAAGIHRSGYVLGLHRPRYEEAFFAKLPLEQANAKYSAVIEQIKAYLVEMGVGDAYLRRMLRVSSSEMEILTREEAERDLNGFIPAMAEWLKAKCGELSEREERLVSDWGLYMALKDENVTELASDLREYLLDKAETVTPEIERQYRISSSKGDKITHCRNGTMYQERKRVGPKNQFDGFQEVLGPDGWPMIVPPQK
ncbi:hypothetical protein [Microvirga splendida]|uniref:Uncharacterized protein n=1 Tax=Microvirga splendida TaxID=2795727 RepID=A0ABS0XZC5_9HYPH|nr:hypothetical protein [Microvirga splendida]MBJ6125410.1 hypothetical protein [Microvirga splendida]